MIINVMDLFDNYSDNDVYEAFSKFKDKFDGFLCVEERNIIRDGIGDKLIEAIYQFPKTNDGNTYEVYVETMLRVALLCYDQHIYIKPKMYDLLTDWGPEKLYIYLLSIIKKHSTKNFDEVSQWLDLVFAPVTKSSFCISIIEDDIKSDKTQLFEAYRYVKKQKKFNICEYKISSDNANNELFFILEQVRLGGEQ